MKKNYKRKFKKIHQYDDVIIYENVAWAVHLKRKMKVACVKFLDEGKATNRTAFFFSSDLELDAKSVYQFYKSRFQIDSQ